MNMNASKHTTKPAKRVNLSRRDAISVARNLGVKVVDGTAWVTYAGKDMILTAGRVLKLDSPDRNQKAVISAAGRSNAEIEIFSRN